MDILNAVVCGWDWWDIIFGPNKWDPNNGGSEESPSA